MNNLPSTGLEWAMALICGAIGFVVGYVLPVLFIGLPIILIVFFWVSLQDSLWDLLFSRKNKQQRTERHEPFQAWMWQAPLGGFITGFAANTLQNGWMGIG